MMGWIEETLDWCERLGYLDDAKVARDRARSLRRRGASTRAVRAKLHEKGIASEHVVKVTRADDVSVVLEDSSGLLVDPTELTPGTEVVVHVATGRPFG